MTVRYVGIGGSNANNGLSWATRKLTLNGVEDTPVQAGDTVYVGAGTYRERLTCDVSGSSGSPITYIGDYDGTHTDGVGGVVRITGSDDDKLVGARNQCIFDLKNHRKFNNFLVDSCSTSYALVYVADRVLDSLTVENCIFMGEKGVINANNKFTNLTINNCCFMTHRMGIVEGKSTTDDDGNNLISNCIFTMIEGNEYAVLISTGGWTVKNCTFMGCHAGVRVQRTLNAGQIVNVNNCIFSNIFNSALAATTAGNLVEDYNSLYRVEVARSNVAVGEHSVTYPMMPDTRWFFEMVNGGNIVTPFDLASYSQLIGLAGTNPTATDMRGTTVQGAQREWGALEYDSTLDIEAGSGGGGGGAVSIQPIQGSVRL